MDVDAPSFDQLLPSEPFTAATVRVNEWRGRCLNAFSRAELAVTKALAAMAAVPERGAAVALPHLVGQRFEALASALASGGPFHGEAGRIAEAIRRFRAHDGLRVMLCHGVGTVSLDRRACWTLVLRTATLRGGSLSQDVLVVTQAEADDLLDELFRSAQALSARLGSLRASLAATA